MVTKFCPICKIEKSTDEFHKYFSKERQKYRVSNYCKPCGRLDSNERAKLHYQKNRAAKIRYAFQYYLANKERQDEQNRLRRQRRRNNLEPIYVRDLMTQKGKFRMHQLHENPELVELYKNKVLLKRTLKKIRNGKKQIIRSE